MLAISLAALLLICPQTTSAIQDNAQDQASQAQASQTSNAAQANPSKAETSPKDALPDTDPAAMNQPPNGSQGVLVNGNARRMPDSEIQKKLAESRARNEPHRQAAMRINEMAANIHSEKDARVLVDSIAEELTNHKHLLWAALKYRHHVARAEFEAVSDPANLIPDQRIADIWNEYVREIDAPDEGLVTQEEVHRLRSGRYRMSKLMWLREQGQTIWTMPNVHAVAKNGMIADGGRPLEMLDILNRLYSSFPEIVFARDRMREQNSSPSSTTEIAPRFVSRIGSGRGPASSISIVTMPADPIRRAEARYQKEHGETAYRQLLERLFDELFPPQ
jgi:hypothetical protein